jgi:dGTPase
MKNHSSTILANKQLAVCAKKSYRFFNERPMLPGDSAFTIDRRRIVKSTAFRRLGYKTQAFANAAGDHYRTRLTHSLEVAQISRLISYSLDLNADLAETIALAHDLGHPPFGHAGEAALNKAAVDYLASSGFDHNAHTLRIMVFLEQIYPDFDGLNLTWDTIEGVAKHNGPLTGEHCHNPKISPYLSQLADIYELKPESFPSLEAQVAGLADDIAYCNHDLDDGIRAGFFRLEDLRELKQIWQIINDVDIQYPHLADTRRKSEIIRRLTHLMISDVINQTNDNLTKYNIKTVEDARNHSSYLVNFSPEIENLKNKLKDFLRQKVYTHYEISRMTKRAQHIVTTLFNYFVDAPECLPAPWRDHYTKAGCDSKKVQTIIDYIAGMTDRYAIKEYRNLNS